MFSNFSHFVSYCLFVSAVMLGLSLGMGYNPCNDDCSLSLQPSEAQAAQSPENVSYDEFFWAIAQVESNHDDNAVGDGGDSIGRYQIQYPYWFDATEFSGIGGRYQDVKDKSYAESIMIAYFNRYAREAWKNKDWEVLARIHNGGPRGNQRNSTIPYWNKVQKHLE